MEARGFSLSPRARIFACLLAAITVAIALVLVLSPDQPGPPAGEAEAARYFEPEAIAAADDYRDPQRLIGLGLLVVELGLLAAFAIGRPRKVRGWLDRLEGRRRTGALLAGAGISLLIALASLPISLIFHERAVDAGISVQSLGPWLFDKLRGGLIGALYAGLGATLLVLLQRRASRLWPLIGAAIVTGFAIVTTFLAPIVLGPIFNDFERLPEGELRSDVLELADKAGVDIGDVYLVDASRRSTALNAYVDGFGSTRRVVLYDNLADGADREALRSVVAHELSHVENRDIPKGLLFVALVAPLGMLFVRELGGALAARGGTGPGKIAAIPAYGFAITLTALLLGIVGNQLSRAVEERADRFAIELTGSPEGLIELQTTTAASNLSQPEPPAWSQFLFGSHPTKLERLGIAEAYQRERDGSAPVGSR